VDAGELLELAPKWGRNMVTGFASIGGRAVGIVANQPRYMGGVIDVEACEKAARFVRTCDAYGLPLVVFVDTPGFMPGTKQEASGIINRGAGLVNAFASATVPRFTIVLRKAYGGAYIAMNAKDLGATLTFAWPGAQIGIMDSRQAVRIVHRRDLAACADPEGLLETLAREYARANCVASAAADDGYVDEVIPPAQTRARLVHALSTTSRA
jgi:acetyl-CoA carboxylase carboxyltransferase component